jgi:C4-dicarboxylate-specific signal transduction histidine kinase
MSPDHHAREGMDIDGSTIITIRDVTSEKEAARQSAEYEDCMAEASRVISYAVITGGLVHEISQPLAALRNYVHLLKTSPDFDFATASHRMIVGHMGEEANRVSEIIRHVRLMGPQEARLDGDCCLSEAISQSVRLLTLGMHPPPAIKIRKVDEEALHVRGSLPLLGQVIVNLLRNALQASAAAGKAGAVVVLRRSGGFAEIAVADFGEGVRPEAAGRLFEPFVRSNTGGMGLGLAICNRIASNLGGSISWENRFSGGAVFTFHVPLFKKG